MVKNGADCGGEWASAPPASAPNPHPYLTHPPPAYGFDFLPIPVLILSGPVFDRKPGVTRTKPPASSPPYRLAYPATKVILAAEAA